jgi:hypothetical protein
MSQKKSVLLQLDPDIQASSFDALVAIDAGVDVLLSRSGVQESHVASLVHGMIFTRGIPDLNRSAIFIGGSNLDQGERLADLVRQTFFGPMRVSVLLDSNGANSTAAAAVLCCSNHLPLQGAVVAVLGATGPVGQRVARLLLGQGASVILQSRSVERGRAVQQSLADRGFDVDRIEVAGPWDQWQPASLERIQGVIACGAAGAVLATSQQLNHLARLQVAIDLNAVPPLGLEPIGVMDQGKIRGARHDYGAIGVGGLKMKIHKAAIRQLFERADQFLDAEELFQIGQQIQSASSGGPRSEPLAGR